MGTGSLKIIQKVFDFPQFILCPLPWVRSQPPSDSYEGDGFVIVRHPDTAVVENALIEIVSTIRVELA